MRWMDGQPHAVEGLALGEASLQAWLHLAAGVVVCSMHVLRRPLLTMHCHIAYALQCMQHSTANASAHGVPSYPSLIRTVNTRHVA
jgi:hypothetical protein